MSEQPPEAPSYVEAADKLGESILRRQHAKGLPPEMVPQMVELAKMELLERIAVAAERTADAVQMVAQVAGGFAYAAQEEAKRHASGGATEATSEPEPKRPPEDGSEIHSDVHDG